MRLFEQYRPKTWDELVGHDKIKAQIDALRKRGLGGRAYWITGGSGRGKTTIAYLIAHELADDWFVSEIDATQLTPARLKEIEQSSRLYASGLGGRAYIVNEAQGLRKDTIRQLLVTLERSGLPDHVAWIFTTTKEQGDLFENIEKDESSALLSRCERLDLAARNLTQAMAARAKEIAVAEGLDGRPIAAYVKRLQDHRNNMRALLQDIESGAMMAAAS